MSADHLQFLKDKFILDLEDAEEEHSGENEIPLLAHFLQIRDVLKAKDITLSEKRGVVGLKNCLYNAISALEECVVLSEKREPRKKKDGPMHGYTLAEHWILCKTRKLLVQVKRKLTAPADAIIPGMTDMAGSSSSTSLPLIPRDDPWNFDPRYFQNFYGQRNEIIDRLDFGKGFQEIGIVGIGGSGKTTLAQLVFTKIDGYLRDNRIWICLFPKLSGDVDFKEMIKDMLKQCKAVGDYEDFDEEEQSEEAAAVDDEDYDGVEVEELLDNLGKALSMGCMSRFEEIWGRLERYKLKLKDEVIEQCDGLPLAMHTLEPAIEDQILGKEHFFGGIHGMLMLVLVNLEDDAILGNELLLSWRGISANEECVWF